MAGKAKNTNYILSSYRIDVPKNEDINEFIKKNNRHGQYACVIQKGKRVVFAKSKGYLLGEHINEYKKHPKKFAYIEKVADNSYIVISIYNGAVFYDSALSNFSQIVSQVQILMSLNEDSVELSCVGLNDHAALQDLQTELGDQLKIQHLKASLTSNFKPKATFLVKNIQNVRTQRSYKAFLVVGILVVIVALGYVVVQHFKNSTTKPVVVVPKVQVDLYRGYKSAFSKPTMGMVVSIMVPHYRQIYNRLDGMWAIDHIKFNGHLLIFDVTSQNKDAATVPMRDFAHQWGMHILYSNHITKPDAKLSISVPKKQLKAPQVIVPVRQQVLNYLATSKSIFGPNWSCSQEKMASKGVYKTMTLTCKMQHSTIYEIMPMLNIADQYPARILKFDITGQSDGFTSNVSYGLTYTVAFYGD